MSYRNKWKEEADMTESFDTMKALWIKQGDLTGREDNIDILEILEQKLIAHLIVVKDKLDLYRLDERYE